MFDFVFISWLFYAECEQSIVLNEIVFNTENNWHFYPLFSNILKWNWFLDRSHIHFQCNWSIHYHSVPIERVIYPPTICHDQYTLAHTHQKWQIQVFYCTKFFENIIINIDDRRFIFNRVVTTLSLYRVDCRAVFHLNFLFLAQPDASRYILSWHCYWIMVTDRRRRRRPTTTTTW